MIRRVLGALGCAWRFVTLRAQVHRAERCLTAAGWAFRCEGCGRPALTAEELEGAGAGHVDPNRRTFTREERYRVAPRA